MYYRHVTAVALATLCLASLTAQALAGDDLYDDLLGNLYGRLSDLDSNYINEDFSKDPEVDVRSDWSDFYPVEDKEAQIRDHEYTEHSSNPDGGFIHVSGGAGEGKQHLTPEGSINNTQEVKSDESLPFYCHPPNPCPKGRTEKDGCQTDIPDQVDFQRRWIKRMEARGLCACDEEHMFNCPQGAATINTAKAQQDRDQIDDVLDSLFGDDSSNNPYSKGSKRETLVAKKSPIVKKRSAPIPKQPHSNPFLEGERLGTVAKKGHGYNKPAM